MMHVRPMRPRHDLHELALHLVGSRGTYEAQPVCDAEDVRVDRDRRGSERDGKDDVRGLAADAGQAEKVLHAARHLAVESRDDLARCADDAFGLGPEKSTRVDVGFELAGRERSERLRRGELPEQRRGDQIDARVRALRRQNDSDQQLECIAEPQGRRGVGIFRAEALEYRCLPLPLR